MSPSETSDPPLTNKARIAATLFADGILLGLPTILYARALGRGFVSEDFVILRTLHGYGIAEVVREFAGPWLGCLDFYRPLSTLVLRGALGVFGLNPLSFDLFHLALHLACALLVSRIARARMGSLAGLAAGLLFALVPLHPNTVSFLASFATLYSTFFALLAIRCLDARRDFVGLLAMAAALWSYEGAVAAPIAAAFWVLFASPRSWLEPRRRRLAASLVGLVAAFLWIRARALGVSIGGYDAFRERFSLQGIAALGRDLLLDLRLLLVPGDLGRWAWPLLGLMLLSGVVSMSGSRRSGAEARFEPAGRLSLLSLLGVLLALAPFAFVHIIPAVGRYAYFASLWSSMLVASLLVASWSQMPQPPARALRLGLWMTLVACEGAALSSSVDRHREAARAADKVRASIESAVPTLPRGEDVFIASVPDFVRDKAGTPLAQVHHWGLTDRFLPPFRSETLPLVSIPPLTADELAPLTEAGATVFRYDASTERLDRLDRASGSRTRVRIDGPQGEIPADRPLRIEWTPRPGGRHRVVVLSRALSQVLDGDRTPGGVTISESVLLQVAVLYDGRIWYWVEAREDSGGLLLSALRSVRVILPRG